MVLNTKTIGSTECHNSLVYRKPLPARMLMALVLVDVLILTAQGYRLIS